MTLIRIRPMRRIPPMPVRLNPPIFRLITTTGWLVSDLMERLLFNPIYMVSIITAIIGPLSGLDLAAGQA